MGTGKNRVESRAQMNTGIKRIIYIGNKLEAIGASPTTIDFLSKLLKKEKMRVITASSKKNRPGRLFEMLFTLARTPKPVDYVLIDTYSTQNFWYAVLSAQVCRARKIDYIPILHGGNLEKRLQQNKRLCRDLFGKAFVNIAPSHFLLDKFIKYGFTNLRYIPNPVKLENYHFKKRNQLQPKLLWVRSFAEIYNPLMALKILQLLLPEFPDAELCMMGGRKDSSLEDCRKYAEENELPVKFTGKLHKKQWIKMASDFSIFLNTSNIDNTPVSVIEAMALGLPVVSCQVGGMPYLIKNREEGILIEKNNPQAGARAVKFLLQYPQEAQKLSFAARRKAEKFDWEIVRQEWLEVLT
ncbi:glycosyltransferase family 4 protein [Autumnicola musiva]|uniref:Glycosyltransferase n=1 Tax=Autumnicola musiva TaxID=3075589 RepID=A0ABU3D5K8_9FLAO|nr:glycosyltransferase [Zunongwangia sp. F117]MDT0676779.1 glycosyltransferase [Zunongwangia sp. F117]